MKITIEITSIEDVRQTIAMLTALISTPPTALELAEPVSALGITIRSINCLKAEGIETISDLLKWSANDLLKTPNLGRKSLYEIIAALKNRNLELS